MNLEGSRGGPPILLAEDMQGHAGELIGGLSDEGYQVDTAETAEAAVHALESVEYAALLLDIELPLGEAEPPKIANGTPPERAGIEVLRYARSRPNLVQLPVIAVSGLDHRAFWNDMVHELQSEELHVAAIVRKPSSPREVIRELARVTGWHGSLFAAYQADDPSYGE